jgi:flagella basal body P-ring formation protein FlgA
MRFISAVAFTLFMIISLWRAGCCDNSRDIDICARAKAFLQQKISLPSPACELKPCAASCSFLPCIEGADIRFPRWGKYWVAAEIYSKGRLIRTSLIRFSVQKSMEVYCATRRIRAKDAAVASDYEKVARSVDADSLELKKYITSLDSLKDKRTRYCVPQGAILTCDMLEPVPLINVREEARILIIKENFAIESAGRALDDGYPGSSVRVRLDSGKVMKGTVNAEGLVEVKI